MSLEPLDGESALIEAFRAMYRGMLDRDMGLLDSLLDAGYTLTHLTGYRQSRAEWLAHIDSGEMRYHSAEEHSVSVTITDDSAVLVGRNIVDATIWGSRGTWHLQLTTKYQRREADWIALRTVARTY